MKKYISIRKKFKEFEKKRFQVKCIYEPRGEKGLEGFQKGEIYNVEYDKNYYYLYNLKGIGGIKFKPYEEDAYIGKTKSLNKYFKRI